MPVPTALPPLDAVNQLKVPIVVEAPSIKVPVPHLLPGVTLTTGNGLTVAVTVLLKETQSGPLTIQL